MKIINEIKFYFLSNLWTILIVQITSIILFRTSIGYCEEQEYWDLPYEKSPELKKQIEDYKAKCIAVEKDNVLHMNETPIIIIAEKTSNSQNMTKIPSANPIIIDKEITKIQMAKDTAYIKELRSMSTEGQVSMIKERIYKGVSKALKASTLPFDMENVKLIIYDYFKTEDITRIIWEPRIKDDIGNKELIVNRIVESYKNEIKFNSSATNKQKEIMTHICTQIKMIGSAKIQQKEPSSLIFNEQLYKRIYTHFCKA